MRPTTVVSAAGATMAVLLVLPAGSLAGGTVLLAGLATVAGTLRHRRRLVSVGAVGFLVGFAIAGAGGLPPGYLLVATVGAVVAWDAADTALDLQATLPPESVTRRGAAVHLGATTLTTAVFAGLAYSVWILGQGRLPGASAPLLAVGAILVGAGLAARRASAA